jgi:hypothetical protein
MILRLIPIVLLCACAAQAPLPTAERPELAQAALPYAQPLRDVGITRVISPGNGAMVQLETLSGPVYVRYPQDLPPTAFVLDVTPDGLSATAASFDRTRDVPVLATILPAAIREAATNNVVQWVRANPWN